MQHLKGQIVIHFSDVYFLLMKNYVMQGRLKALLSAHQVHAILFALKWWWKKDGKRLLKGHYLLGCKESNKFNFLDSLLYE